MSSPKVGFRKPQKEEPSMSEPMTPKRRVITKIV